jgi:hypothetical protein
MTDNYPCYKVPPMRDDATPCERERQAGPLAQATRRLAILAVRCALRRGAEQAEGATLLCHGGTRDDATESDHPKSRR